MRETLAKTFAALLTTLVVLLSAFFADRRNTIDTDMEVEQPPAVRTAPLSAFDAAAASRGRAVYEEQACSRCHSVEGRGNPRAPLDGVGTRRTPAELADWITGRGPAASALTRSAQRAKASFRSLPETDLDALVSYLGSLR